MRVLLVHPSPLMYSELYLRLEPLGLERVAAAIRTAGHEVRLLDLQIFQHADYWRELDSFAPQAVGFSVNYLANVPEVIDLAKDTKAKRPDVFILVGGHSASFVAREFLEHAEGAQGVPAAGVADGGLEDHRHRLAVAQVQGPAAVLVAALLDDLDRLGEARVGGDAGAAQVVQAAQDVIVIAGREGEARPAAVDHFAGRQRAQHAALEEVFVGPGPGLRHGGGGAARLLVGQQAFQDADGAVER